MTLTLEDLMKLDSKALHAALLRGHPLDTDALAGRMYLGVDLSLPGWARRLLWHTFRKTFVRDEESGEVRGWNVKMEQRGVDGPRVPRTRGDGRQVTFGHYRVRRAHGDFPGQYRGTHYLDYRAAGNLRRDLAGLGHTPLVAVNEGSQALLLGWEVFRVGPTFLPMPLYWALRDEGPLDIVVEPPRRGKSALHRKSQ